MYIAGQITGVLVIITVIVIQQLKSRKQILWASVLANVLGALTAYLSNGWGAGVTVNFVAILQIFIALWHEKKDTKENIVEKIIFFVLYVSVGIISCAKPLDILAILAAVFYMIAMLQKKEQRIRLWLIANMTSWTIFYAIVGNTALFAQVVGIISALIGLYRYRRKDKTPQSELQE